MAGGRRRDRTFRCCSHGNRNIVRWCDADCSVTLAALNIDSRRLRNRRRPPVPRRPKNKPQRPEHKTPSGHVADGCDWPEGPLADNAPKEVHLAHGIAKRILIQIHRHNTTPHAVARQQQLGIETLYRLINGKSWPNLITVARLEMHFKRSLWGHEHIDEPPPPAQSAPRVHRQRRMARRRPRRRRPQRSMPRPGHRHRGPQTHPPVRHHPRRSSEQAADQRRDPRRLDQRPQLARLLHRRAPRDAFQPQAVGPRTQTPTTQASPLGHQPDRRGTPGFWTACSGRSDTCLSPAVPTRW